jgi:cytochrome c-type biogenesis protein CcmH
MIRIGLAALLLLITGMVSAGEAVPTSQDPVAQARAVELEKKLRCLVCQNQTIADSEADLAKDLRRQIADQINAGRSDADIIAFMTDRYGDFVLYQPPVKGSTLALWFGPALLLMLAFAILIRTLQRHTAGQSTALTETERARARELLEDRVGRESGE